MTSHQAYMVFPPLDAGPHLKDIFTSAMLHSNTVDIPKETELVVEPKFKFSCRIGKSFLNLLPT